MMVVSERMSNGLGCLLNSSAETVVFTVGVVVSHVLSRLFELDVGCGLLVDYNVVLCWSTSLVLDIEIWLDSAAVLTLGDVELSILMSWSVVARVTLVCNVNEAVRGLTFFGDIVRLAVLVAGFLISACSTSCAFAMYLPLSRKIDFGKLVGLLVQILSLLKLGRECFVVVTNRLFGESELWWSLLGTVLSGLVSDVDFFLSESSIFPSDALGSRDLIYLPFYLGFCGSFDGSSVTPVC